MPDRRIVSFQPPMKIPISLWMCLLLFQVSDGSLLLQSKVYVNNYKVCTCTNIYVLFVCQLVLGKQLIKLLHSTVLMKVGGTCCKGQIKKWMIIQFLMKHHILSGAGTLINVLPQKEKNSIFFKQSYSPFQFQQ